MPALSLGNSLQLICWWHYFNYLHPSLLPPATTLGQGNIFRSMCQEFCPRGGMHGRGACVAGACVAGGMCGGGHVWQEGMSAWQGVCTEGGMCGRGACMAGGHVWQGVCMAGGMHDRGVCVVGACVARETCMAGGMHGIQSMSGQYTSYWNAFLFRACFCSAKRCH